MTNLLSPQELENVLRNERYSDIKILPVSESVYGIIDNEHDRLLFSEQVVIDGDKLFARILFYKGCHGNDYYQANVHHKKNFPGGGTSHSYVNTLIEYLNKNNLRKEPPLIKKCCQNY